MSHSPEDRILSPLSKARNVGSAHDGVSAWMKERVTAVALIPLCFWLVWSVVGMAGWSYDDFTAWLSEPVNAVLMILSVIAGFWHAAMGLHVVIEDYVHHHGLKIASVIAVDFFFFSAGVACLFSILKVAFGA